MEPKQRLFIALDVRHVDKAIKLTEQFKTVTNRFKLGSLMAPRAYENVENLGGHGEFFADCKWFDTPDTLRNIGISLILDYDFVMCTVHARGGIPMMKALHDGIHEGIRIIRKTEPGYKDEWQPKLIAVTVLTNEPKNVRRVLELAEDALEAGMDGVTSPPYAIRAVRKRFGKKLLIVVPGIRFRNSQRDNHRETMTPFQAIRADADYIVMGRPITKAPDPVAAVKRALEEIKRAEREFK